jgi:hypothetical protein
MAASSSTIEATTAIDGSNRDVVEQSPASLRSKQRQGHGCGWKQNPDERRI